MKFDENAVGIMELDEVAESGERINARVGYARRR